jgi:hypothetical protein
MIDLKGSNHGLRVGFQNVNGLSGKAEATRTIMETAELDILFIAETWLSDHATNPLKDLTFLDIRGKKSTNGRRVNGGIIGLCKNHNLKSQLKEIDGNNVNWAAVFVQGITIYVGYFSPKADNDKHLKDFLNKAQLNNESLVIGDLNAHHTALGSNHCNQRGHWLLENLGSLTYCHPQSGTFSSNIGTTRPDHFLTNSSIVEDDLVIHEDIITLSDHRLMSITLNTIAVPTKVFRRLNICKMRAQKYKDIYSKAMESVALDFIKLLDKTSWPPSQEKIDEIWTVIKEKTYSCLEATVGEFHFKPRTNKEFWNKELESVQEDILLLKETMRNNNATNEMKMALKFYQSKMDTLIAKQKQKIYRKYAESLEQGEFGAFLRMVFLGFFRLMEGSNNLPGF